MNKKSGVYKIVNTLTGEIYVGSSVNIHNRWIRHKWELKCNRHNNKYLQASYNKYGVEYFSYEVLELCLMAKRLVIYEQQWLDHFIFLNCRVYNNALLAIDPFRKYFSVDERIKAIKNSVLKTKNKNKEKMKEYSKNYNRNYYINNRETELLRSKKRRCRPGYREKFSSWQRKHRNNNKNEVRKDG